MPWCLKLGKILLVAFLPRLMCSGWWARFSTGSGDGYTVNINFELQ
jgi:hypothetical protein